MAARYDIKPEDDGWTAYETTTGIPAKVNDMVQVGLSLEDADKLADLLNRLTRQEARKMGSRDLALRRTGSVLVEA